MHEMPNGRGILYVAPEKGNPTLIAFCTSQQALEILQGEEFEIGVVYDEAHFIDNNDWDFKLVDGKWVAEPNGPETQTQGLGEILFL